MSRKCAIEFMKKPVRPAISIVLGSLIPIFLFLSAVVLLGLSSCGFFNFPPYLIDNLSQLRFLYTILLFPLLLSCMLVRSIWGAIISSVALALNVTAFVPLYQTGTPVSAKPSISIVTMNIWGAHNHRYSDAVKYIRAANPDVICLNEITKDWMNEMRKKLPDYAFVFDEGLSGGAAIFSRIPIERQIPPEGPRMRRYGVRGQVTLDNQQVLIIAEHPPAPYMKSNWSKRNAEFNRLINDITATNAHVVLIGDLNCTPWSFYFRGLLEKARLVDSEIANGIQPSWSTLHVLPLVPIDHCLVTNQLCVQERKLGPNIGSDHLPVFVRLAMLK